MSAAYRTVFVCKQRSACDSQTNSPRNLICKLILAQLRKRRVPKRTCGKHSERSNVLKF